jgi:hypothetical protein
VREQRLVFGEAAELYDRARAGYSDQLVDNVLAFTRAEGPTVRAVEVGAGTGKATVAFASRNVEVVALEPDQAMAAVATRNCRRFPAVRIEITSFEDWPLPDQDFDLVFSAQAWHWVRPEVRYPKALEVMGQRGALALFWHRTRWAAHDPIRDELEVLYRRLAPELYARHPGFPGLTPRVSDSLMVNEVEQTGRFKDIEVRFDPWPATFTADAFIDLLMTQSDHRVLADGQRAPIFDGVRGLISDNGGRISVPHETFLLLARVARS